MVSHLLKRSQQRRQLLLLGSDFPLGLPCDSDLFSIHLLFLF